MIGQQIAHSLHRSIVIALIVITLVSAAVARLDRVSAVGGTLVVAVPVQPGLVVCSDKRLYNETTKTYRDDFVKIHKVNDKALFVATHTTGFLNNKTGKMTFDIFDVTQDYVSRNGFSPSAEFWNGLRNNIRSKLLSYLSKLSFGELPETDIANNRLLFNLVFFAVDSHTSKDYSISVFYEKARTPVIDVGSVVAETINSPKLLGKGKEVMTLLSRTPSLANDISILKFDQSYFKIGRTSPGDAASFAGRLFALTNDRLPQTEVSSVHDCAMLSYADGFNWIDDSGEVVRK